MHPLNLRLYVSFMFSSCLCISCCYVCCCFVLPNSVSFLSSSLQMYCLITHDPVRSVFIYAPFMFYRSIRRSKICVRLMITCRSNDLIRDNTIRILNILILIYTHQNIKIQKYTEHLVSFLTF